ncbi:hypothetical protein VNO77_14494 [Canavalia gladiata]|uniref:Uncharacterized protein n=1 Tax=Canavalia gladiata TaxID=3824 RepID=A0AAN9M1W8_CANGL
MGHISPTPPRKNWQGRIAHELACPKCGTMDMKIQNCHMRGIEPSDLGDTSNALNHLSYSLLCLMFGKLRLRLYVKGQGHSLHFLISLISGPLSLLFCMELHVEKPYVHGYTQVSLKVILLMNRCNAHHKKGILEDVCKGFPKLQFAQQQQLKDPGAWALEQFQHDLVIL